MFEALTAFDLPYNRSPSLHIGVLVLLWLRLGPHVPPSWRPALHGWFTLIGVSVLTTYQHHVIDIPAGVAAAGLCIAVTAPRRLHALQPRSSAASNNRAFSQSRRTVRSVTPSASAISVSFMPPK
jgi:hypothetical protein